MQFPQGRLCRSTIVSTVQSVLVMALDRSFTGYSVLSEPAIPDSSSGVITFERGVPGCWYHATDGWQPSAVLARLARFRPCRADLYQLPRSTVRTIHERTPVSPQPTAPASYFDETGRLVRRTERRLERSASDDRCEQGDAVVSFLEDPDRITLLQDDARQAVRLQARQWDLEALLADVTER